MATLIDEKLAELRKRLKIENRIRDAHEHVIRIDGKKRQGWRLVVTDLRNANNITAFVSD